ncbi:MAG: EpsG family protein [Lachnospiraceae bacterium]|nr:EpsG family protein [Lachnospiraceae bacterium]
MGIYIGLVVIVLSTTGLIDYLLKNRTNNILKIRKIEVILASVALGILMGFRGKSVGTDTLGIMRLYVNSRAGFEMFLKQAPIYAIYSKALFFFFPQAQAIIILNAIIIVTCYGYVIYKESTDIKTSWYIYITLGLYLFAFNATRQCVAMAIVLVAYSMLKSQRIKTSIVFFLIAVGVHQISIVAILFYIVMLIKPDLKKTIIFSVIIALIEGAYKSITLLFIRFFPAYVGYLRVDNLTKNDGKTYSFYMALLLILIIVFDCIYLEKNKSYIDDKGKKDAYQKIAIICVYIVTAFVLRNMNYPARLSLYFSQVAILYLPEFFIRQSKNGSANGKILKVMICGVLMIPYFKNMQAYIPYIPFWK